MIRLRNASVMVAFYLLTSAATASAECAWVLWNEQSLVSQTNPFQNVLPQSAYESREDCSKALAEKVRQADVSAMFPGAKIVKTDDTIMIAGPRGMLTYTYRCLPDTIDPRGPKTR